MAEGFNLMITGVPAIEVCTQIKKVKVNLQDTIDLFDTYADELARELASLRVMNVANVADIRGKLAIRMRLMMGEIANEKRHPLLEQCDSLKKELLRNDLVGFQRKKIQDRLAAI